MYTKILRKIIIGLRRMAGHCDGSGDGSGGGTGHCY